MRAFFLSANGKVLSMVSASPHETRICFNGKEYSKGRGARVSKRADFDFLWQSISILVSAD